MLLVAGALSVVSLVAVLVTDIHHGIDLDVYRLGGRAWLTGQPLYGRLPPTTVGVSLPFTYPPLAAVLFSPLALVPRAVAVALVLAGSLAALTVTCYLVVVRAAEWFGRWQPAVVVAAALPVLTASEPIRETLTFGQVNLVLMAMVAVDCLGGGKRWPRGVLVGLAAAVKLTPAAFLLFLLVRRDVRALLTSLAAFVLAAGGGFLLARADSVRFWGRAVVDANRTGEPSFASNQSVRGALIRFGLTSGGQAVAWLVVSVLVVALGWVAMRRLLASGVAGAVPLALVVNAVVALLVSPVTWSHHWVWAAPGVLLLLGLALHTGSRVLLAVVGFAAVVFAVGPQWLVPNRHRVELTWNAGQHLVGDLYLWLGLALLVGCAVLRLGAARAAVPARRWQRLREPVG